MTKLALILGGLLLILAGALMEEHRYTQALGEKLDQYEAALQTMKDDHARAMRAANSTMHMREEVTRQAACKKDRLEGGAQ